jgi:hypothetical protein
MKSHSTTSWNLSEVSGGMSTVAAVSDSTRKQVQNLQSSPCALTKHHAVKAYWGSGGIVLTSALDGSE